MKKRYRIITDGSWSKNPSTNYFAGWIDDYREAKSNLRRLKKELGGKMELHEFKGEKLIKKVA